MYASHIANVNPIRYRGYYYDVETGFYYLQSRYYDPEVGRFINADGLVSTGQSILGYNMYAYCGNNPVTGYDPAGTLDWGNLFKGSGWLAVGVTAIAVGVSVLTCGVAAPAIMAVVVGAAKGAALGLAVGAANGAAGGAISHRISTGSWSGAGEAALNGMADGALSGAIAGAITGGIKGGNELYP